MRIVNILLSNQNGGVEQSFVAYTKILKDLNHQVLVIAGKGAPYISDLPSVEIREVDNIFGYYDFPAIFKIRKLIKNFNADLVFAHASRAVILAKKALKKSTPLIAINHSKNVKRSIGADVILSVNKEIFYKTVDLGQPATRSFVMPNFIDVDGWSLSENFDQDSFNLKNKIITIGAVSRLSPEKGLSYLIKALKILSDQNYSVKLKIAGSGALLPELKQLCCHLGLEKKVEFVGWVNDKPAFYKTIDIFCLPSLEETFGMVLLEAMAAFKPIIATNCDGPAMVLKNNVSAILVDKSKPELLPDLIAQSIIKLLNNPDMIFDLTTNAKKDLLRFYSYPVVKEKIQEVVAIATNNK